MKQKICVHRIVRLLPVAAFSLLALFDLLVGRASLRECLCVDIYCALQMLMLYPVSKDPVRPSVIAAGVSFLLFFLLKLPPAPFFSFILAGQFVMIVFLARKLLARYADVPPLFHASAVWTGVEDCMHLFHCAVVLFTGTALMAALSYGRGLWVFLGLEGVLFVLQYYRVYTRSTLLLGAKKEEQIRSGHRSPGFRMPVQYVDSDSRSAILFNDVVKIMETRKPYLQDDFSVEDLSRMTHTNRMYLSRSINFHSGRNFNQLVNYYRVKYAVELLKKDQGLRMNELSQMCGFHTVVSFNMAFKLNERMTPSEFARSLKKLT